VARQLRTKPRIFPFRQESYAEEVREEKGRENDYEEKEELETLNRLSSYCNYAVSTGCSVGRHMLWNAKIKPEGFCAVRPSSSASLHRIIWGTKIPLDTPLARLVMADPAIGVIERDIALPHIIAPV
jgi:hypothetical protein